MTTQKTSRQGKNSTGIPSLTHKKVSCCKEKQDDKPLTMEKIMEGTEGKVKIVLTHRYQSLSGINVESGSTFKLPGASVETIHMILSRWGKRVEQYFKDHPEATAKDKKDIMGKVEAMMEEYDAWYKGKQKLLK
ncbi:MAG TPA: hypothetical protein PLV42_05490 [bacterium]|nr:hypothetical protein [bacterium]